jgi:diapolycopene oxygenase
MSNKAHQSVVVAGSGLGGLAAACTLAARGHKIILFAINRWLGGKAAVLQQDGFRFDRGSTILTLSSGLRRIYSEAGLALEDQLLRLDPQWRGAARIPASCRWPWGIAFGGSGCRKC